VAELIRPIELDFLCEALHIGELPYPLEIHSHGATTDDRAALRRQVHDELRERDLLDRSGRLEPHIEEWLGVLAQPAQSVDSVFLPELAGPPVRALAAAGRGATLLAIQHPDGGLELRQLDRSGLISAAVDLLPKAPRGTEPSITLPAEEFALAGAGSRGATPGRASEVETRQALARLTGQPSVRGGQLAANSRGPLSGRRRSPVLAWFDNASGRYLGQVKVASDGREWTTLAPADSATLRKRLSEMMTEVND
jgi:ESX secretion-associated protein EspG